MEQTLEQLTELEWVETGTQANEQFVTNSGKVDNKTVDLKRSFIALKEYYRTFFFVVVEGTEFAVTGQGFFSRLMLHKTSLHI